MLEGGRKSAKVRLEMGVEIWGMLQKLSRTLTFSDNFHDAISEIGLHNLMNWTQLKKVNSQK